MKPNRWHMPDVPTGLSVTPEPNCHLLVACREARKLNVFTTHGELVRGILLHDELVRPLSAVQFGEQFIVSHGWLSDEKNQVCVVNAEGDVTRRYGWSRGSAAWQLNYPIRLTRDSDGNIFVADYYNKRILLLSPPLDHHRDLISLHDVIQVTDEDSVSVNFRPRRLCLDEARGRLFVADDINKDVMVFQIRDVQRLSGVEKCVGNVNCV